MLGEMTGTRYLVVHEGFQALNDFVLAPLVHLLLAGETGERCETERETEREAERERDTERETQRERERQREIGRASCRERV